MDLRLQGRGRIVVLVAGAILIEGTPEEISRDPEFANSTSGVRMSKPALELENVGGLQRHAGAET